MRLPIALSEPIPMLLRLSLLVGVDDLAQQILGLRLQPKRKLVQHVDDLMVPATELLGFREDIGQCTPDPEVPIGDQPARRVQSSPAKVPQDPRPVAQDERLVLEYLPAYAPELNPVEYIWGYWKRHELPNFCPRDFGQAAAP